MATLSSGTIARILRRTNQPPAVVEQFADVLFDTNEFFDRNRFLMACGWVREPVHFRVVPPTQGGMVTGPDPRD